MSLVVTFPFPSNLVKEIENMETTLELKLFHNALGHLVLTEKDRSHLAVKPVWASPLTHPGKFLAFLNPKGDEVALVEEPSTLEPDSLKAAKAELNRRYLTATVTRIIGATVEFGATYWHVETDRGHRDFVTQNLQENAQWLSEGHLLLIDVDGNRFEVLSTHDLDLRSQEIIERIL